MMATTGSSRHSVAPSITSVHDPPPSYTEAIREQRSPISPQAFQNLSLGPPPGPRSPRPRTPVSPRPRPASPLSRIPTVGQCLTHLKLLQCFHRLREDIGSADGLFGLRNENVSPGLDSDDRGEVLARMCEKRWAIYVTRACLRFQSFWRVLQSGSKMLVEDDLKSKEYATCGTRARPIMFTPDNLPPLDILMVYHAFMLNPRNFFADCIRFGKTGVWAAGMPWDVIESVMQGRHCDYQPNERARTAFQQRVRLPWDNLDGPATMKLRCPRCSESIDAPWTTTDAKRTWASEAPGEDGQGFADRGFQHDCECGLKMTHEVLRTQRFKNDMRALFTQSIPMPGTFVTKDGLPAMAQQSAPGAGAYQSTFPNRLLKSGLGKIIAQTCSAKQSQPGTMVDVLGHFNEALKNPKMLRRAASSKLPPRPPTMLERLAIRRMMSTYWDNSSMFNMDLVGAVIRQNSFTTKMQKIDWLYSPAAETTMQRLISKYENFILLMSRYPDKTVVPTLDVDLAWHTHQLTPFSYQTYTLEKTGTFINHDDKIDENALSTSFQWTSRTYQETFSRVYSECTCWYCELTRLDHEPAPTPTKKALTRLLKSSSTPSTSDPVGAHYAQIQASTSPATPAAHISAHNSTRASIADVDAHIKHVVQQRRLDRAHELACLKAEKKGLPEPSRDDGVLRWGHRVRPREDWGPFMADTCLSAGLFVANPSCAAQRIGEAEGSVGVVDDSAGLGAMGGCLSLAEGGKGIAVGACGSCGACGGCGGGAFGGGGGSACGGGGASACGGGGGGAAGCGGGGGGGGC